MMQQQDSEATRGASFVGCLSCEGAGFQQFPIHALTESEARVNLDSLQASARSAFAFAFSTQKMRQNTSSHVCVAYKYPKICTQEQLNAKFYEALESAMPLLICARVESEYGGTCHVEAPATTAPPPYGSHYGSP